MTYQPTDTTAKPKARKAHSDTLPVDFSKETIIFRNMDLLTQPGVFALTQAKAIPTSVLDLFQGVSRHN
jgi:flagellin-like hook-associated protein FlgL